MTSTILEGDAAQVLATLPADSVHAAVTSPPYYALRDYQANGQIGREATPEAYVARLVAVFRQVRRVLRPDGTIWVNIGDTYANGTVPGIPRKSLIGVPWMLAFALRADGWTLRGEVIWEKPNATPESVRDRPSRSHEQLFLLSKSPRYFYDKEAVREPNTGKPPTGKKGAALRQKARDLGKYSVNNVLNGKWAERLECHGGFVAFNPRGRNRRSVWRVATSGFDARSVGVSDVDHFAVFPPELVRPCIRASTPEGGCCPACLAPYTRHVADYEDLEDTWIPSCSCPPAEPVPAVVLDPFCGSGTSGVVCAQAGRSFIGTELNPSYARLARARIAAASKG